jgi:hypothetical protein
MSASVTLDPIELDRMKLLFLNRMYNFGEFTDAEGHYWNQERAYKQELAEIATESLPQSLFSETNTAAGTWAVVTATNHVLQTRLRTIDLKQNLLGWRYSDFLRKIELKDARRYAIAMGTLLYGDGPSPLRAEVFTKAIWPLLRGKSGRNPFAEARLFPTLFLMLLYPQSDIAVRTDMFEIAARTLLGHRVLRNEIFSAAEYEDVLLFSAAVRDALELWGWRPHDMIDVHSFLWITTRTSYGEDEG